MQAFDSQTSKAKRLCTAGCCGVPSPHPEDLFFRGKAPKKQGQLMLVPSLMLFLNLMLNLLLLVLCIFDIAKCVSGFPVVLTKCYKTLTREIKTITSHAYKPHI